MTDEAVTEELVVGPVVIVEAAKETHEGRRWERGTGENPRL